MRNNLSVALTALSVEEFAKEDLSSTNLVFICPLSVEGEERNISNLASKKICWIAGSTVGQDGLLRQFLYNDAGILEKDSFDVYPFFCLATKSCSFPTMHCKSHRGVRYIIWPLTCYFFQALRSLKKLRN